MKKLIILGSAVMVVSTAHAQLLGASVNGQLNFNGDLTTNFFDKANGLVPAGYLNSGPSGTPTVVIANPAKEFGFNDGANLDEADFTANTLTIHDLPSAGGSSQTKYTFTCNAFAGMTMTQTSNNFVGLTKSLVGNVVTIDIPLFADNNSHTAVFTFVPEPASFAGIGIGLAMLIRRRKKSN